MSGSSSFIGYLIGVGTLILSQPVLGKFDRERIRENVEQSGGKVIAMKRRFVWFRLGARYARTYDVTYLTPDSQSVTAICITSMTIGVSWVSDRPPKN
jgi:hypothetical protein